MNALHSGQVSSSSRATPLSGLSRLALTVILVVAAAVRLYGLNWDQNQHLHPDERFIVMVTMDRISLPFPDLADAHLGDPRRSTLNPRSADPATGQPRNFAYGSLPLYLLKLSGHLLHPLWPDAESFNGLTIIGRIWSALFDLGTVLLAFLAARRLYGVAAGLLASSLLALTVLDIQLAHFYASDTLLTFFLMLTLYLALRVLELPSRGRALVMGAAAGLAMACKVSAAPVLLPVGLACLLGGYPATGGSSDSTRGTRWYSPITAATLAILASLFTFLLFQPYVLLDPQPFLRDIQNEGDMVRGVTILPYTIQYLRTPQVVYQVGTLFFWTAGPALTVAVLVGLAAFLVRLVRRPALGEWILAAWLVPYLAINLSFQVKFARYMLPAMPLLVILAAGAVAALLARSVGLPGESRLMARFVRCAGPAVLVLVLVGTVVQAVAFLSIYSRDHSRVTASRWIYDNIPRGATLSAEHWDDPLPLALPDRPGRQPGDYRVLTLPMYDPDTPEKRAMLVQNLSRIDYIVISSNRLYGSIGKVPEAYPLASVYYSLLFRGDLGFDLVGNFTSYPSIGPFQVVDDSADESFTVYDHPKVLIFRKRPDFSPARVQQLLQAVSLENVVPLKQIQSGHNGLLLTEEQRMAQERGGTWSSMYDPNGIANRHPSIFWWLALELMGLLALPLAWVVFERFPDRGYGLAKVVGLLMVSYMAWLLPSLRLVPFGPVSILFGLATTAFLGMVVLRTRGRALWNFYRTHPSMVLAHEVVFILAFALFWLIRVRNPDLWHPSFGGEKPMEFAFLNAVAKSTFFPPYDPWMAGGYINYYYFGYVIVATVMRLTGIVPSVAFNLAIPTMFALAAAGLFSFGFSFALGPAFDNGAGGIGPVGRRAERRTTDRGWTLPQAQSMSLRAAAAGLATAGFVLIAGNLDGAIQLLEGLWRASWIQPRSIFPLVEGTVKTAAGLWAVLAGGRAMPAFDFWRSTRIIGPENPTPITEFPFFTFLYGDLHPHMMAMPLAALALALALAVVWSGRGGLAPEKDLARQSQGLPVGDGGRIPADGTENLAHFVRAWVRDRAVLAAAGGFVVGALQVTNSWDYPTYMLLLSASFLLAAFFRDGRLTGRGLGDTMLAAAAIYLVAQVLFLPFFRSYELFYAGVDPSPGRTSLQHYLVIFGFFVFCTLSALLFRLWRSRRHGIALRALWDRVRGSNRATRRARLWARMVRPSPWWRSLGYMVAGLLAAAFLVAAAHQYLIAFLMVMGLLALLALFEKDSSPERMLLVIFVGLGVALSIGVELVAIKGDIGRMNTVFKFYLQAWLLFGAAAALGAFDLITTFVLGLKGRLKGLGRAWSVVLVVLGLSVLVYPVAATPAKLATRFQPLAPTLDGMAYMREAVYRDQNRDIRLGWDYDAIRWIQANVPGSPVVLEAQVPEYRWGSRVSIYTGLPTVLGWTWHERQQRWGYQWMIDQRLRDIKTMFESSDTSVVVSLLKSYHVRLIYVGDLERAYYPASGLAKFDAMVSAGSLRILYRSDGVTIYWVNA